MLAVVESRLPAFDNDWNDTEGSFRNLSGTSVAVRKSRYRHQFPVPQVGTGKCYRVSWVERFIPEAGVGITSVEVYSPGVYRPAVTLSAPPAGGTQARAVAVMSAAGTVSEIRILNPGLYIPVATLAGGGGSGASVVVTKMTTAGAIDEVAISGGSGYTSTPTITWSAVGTGQVRALATLIRDTDPASPTFQKITGITFSNRGDYRPRVTIAAAINSGTTATAALPVFGTDGRVVSVAVTAEGNYRPALALSAPGGSTATAVANMDPQGGIESVTLTAAGSGYTSAPTLTITARNSGATAADLLLHLGTETPRCAVWDGTTLAGRWVLRTVADAGHALDSIEVVHGGNYLPTVVLSGGGGTGATAVVSGFSADGKVTAITITNGGTGYTSAPTVTITGRNGGSGATATASVSAGAVTGVTVVNQGNYLPTLTISAGGGTGATGTVAMSSAGAVASITLTNPGSGYKSNPLLRLSYYGTETVLLAAHFGTETEYVDGTEPPGAIPKGYVPGEVRTYPVIGDTGTAPWKYYEIDVPTTDGTTTVANVRAVCDCTSC